MIKSTLLTLVIVAALSTTPSYATPAALPQLPDDTTPSTPEPSAHGRSAPGSPTDLAMVRNVLASGLSFMAPRLLESHSIKELSLWGLEGLVAADPTLSWDSSQILLSKQPPQHIVLRRNGHIIFKHTVPQDDDLTGWVEVIIHAIESNWHEGSSFQTLGYDQLLSHFFSGLFQHLDPYSRYLSPTEAAASQRALQDDTCTVGVTLTRHSDVSYPSVTTINSNSTAWEQGVSIGDTLLAVDGHDVRRVPLTILQHWLTGPPGSTVALTFRTHSGSIQTVALSRTRLPQETVFPSHKGRYTILRITRFAPQTAEEVSQYISAALPSDSEHEGDSPESSPTARLPGLIIDLRGNHGGILQQAVVTAALLLNHGIAVTTEGRYPAANHVWTVQGGDLTNDTPVVVLVDKNTASSAEVLAATLADHHRAALVGSYTFGKGLVQVIGDMPNHGELFVTWARNLAPQGWPIQGIGVPPHLCTSSLHPSVSSQISALKHGHSLENSILMKTRAADASMTDLQRTEIRAQCPPTLGSERDLDAALQLLSSHAAYQTALKSVPSRIPSHIVE